MNIKLESINNKKLIKSELILPNRARNNNKRKLIQLYISILYVYYTLHARLSNDSNLLPQQESRSNVAKGG